MILYRADYSTDSGYGHLARSIVLFKAMRRKFSKLKFLAPEGASDFLMSKGVLGTEIISLENSKLVNEIGQYPKAEAVVVDLFSTHRLNSGLSELSEYIERLREERYKIVAIDGYGEDSYLHQAGLKVDIYVQPYFGVEHLPEPSDGIVLKGGEYSLVDEEYFRLRRPSGARNQGVLNIVVSLGGLDKAKHTEKVLKALFSLHKGQFRYNVVLGRDFGEKRVTSIIDEYAHLADVVFTKNVSSLVDCLARADILITSSGMTRYEAVAARVPLIFGSILQQHISSSEAFADATGAEYIGDYNVQSIRQLSTKLQASIRRIAIPKAYSALPDSDDYISGAEKLSGLILKHLGV